MLRRRRRTSRRPLRAQPVIHLVPNIFTVLALCAGLTSIRYALDQRWELAVALIVVAGVLDGLDGRSARLLGITSKLGAQLDSLADFLSFGVAPAMLVYLWSLSEVKAFGWALTLLFATCMALRLARFNTELDEPNRPGWMSRFFTGMPAPAAAGCALVPLLLALALEQDWPQSWPINAAMMIVVSFLMVSRVPTFSIKTVIVRVRPEWIVPTLLGAGLLVAALSSAPWWTLLAVGTVYLISLPIGWVEWYRLKRRNAPETGATEANPSPAAASDTADARDSTVVRLSGDDDPGHRRDAS